MATESMAGITSEIAVGGISDEASKVESAQAAEVRLERQEMAESRQALMSEQSTVSRGKIDRVVNELKEFVQTMQRDLNFHIDDVTGQVVIQVVETSTNQVVRQIPEAEVFAMAQHLEEMLDEMPRNVLIEGKA